MDLNTIAEVARPDRSGGGIDWRDGDAFLAGGTWLFSEPQPHLRRLIDLHALGWTPLTVSEQGLEIAATCEIAKLAALSTPPEWTAAPLIGECCRSFLSSFKIWNFIFQKLVSTIDGSLEFIGYSRFFRWYSRPELNWDQRFRKPLLYPFELREQGTHGQSFQSAGARYEV